MYIQNPNLESIKEILRHHYDTHGVKIKELVEIRKVIELGALRLIIEKNMEVDFQQLHDINNSYYQAIIKQEDTRQADRFFPSVFDQSDWQRNILHVQRNHQ